MCAFCTAQLFVLHDDPEKEGFLQIYTSDWVIWNVQIMLCIFYYLVTTF